MLNQSLSFLLGFLLMLLVSQGAAFRINFKRHFYRQGALRHFTELTLTSALNMKNIQAQIVALDRLDDCGKRLQEGHLVAFPTETVYGLGCHALDENAILKVFAAKERPLTDPLIVHVPTLREAAPLWENPKDPALQSLTKSFWPGPLTLVAKAAAHIPPLVMAHTGYIACRSPEHPLAQALLKVAHVPIAAPSANKFGHVSPTRAEHVYDDLKHEDVWIVESNEVCKVGVESTVAKLTLEGDRQGLITVLRQGAISAQQIEQCLAQSGLSKQYRVELKTKQFIPDHVANVSPGQSIRHYSPNIPSYLVTAKCIAAFSHDLVSNVELKVLSTAIVIDFGGALDKFRIHALAYRDLSPWGNSAEAAQNVFETLRWAEQVEGGTRILFPHLDSTAAMEDALHLAVKDRLIRAASGVAIDSLLEPNEV